ncbi:hypothetical protein LEMLEM_LOCUS19877, partial [Lemmus lemmus]
NARQPGRAPRAAFVRHLGSVAARLLGCEPERGTRRSSLTDPLEATLERQECGWTVGEPRRRRLRRGVLGFCPQGGGPTGAVGGRKKGKQPLKRRAALKFHCSLLL